MYSSGEDIKVEIVSFFFYETLYFFIRNMVTFVRVNTTTCRTILFRVAECHKLDPKMNVNW